ncbi:RNA helicase required for poly(A+) mRNA export, partial [Nowakowskiella sp. JEL0078]
MSENEDGWGKPNQEIDPAASWGQDPQHSKPAAASSSAIPQTSVASLSNLVSKSSLDDDGEPDVAPKHNSLAENAQEVEIKFSETTQSELYTAISSFEDLGLQPELLKGLYAMGFERPSKVQEKALPLLLSNPPQNLIGQSQSGTGKTAAFVLTMLSRVNTSLQYPQALCLAPARELAKQIMDVIQEMGKYTAITTGYAIRASVEKGSGLNQHIIVGTPGTVANLIKRRQLDVSKIKIFVLDEADNMLDQQSLGDQSIRLKNLMPNFCQIVLFSATFPPFLKEFASRFAPKANEFYLQEAELSVEGIKQFYMDCRDEKHKVEVLQQLYGLMTIGQSIVFVRKRELANYLERKLKEEHHEVIALHGGLEPEERDAVMDNFRQGKFKVLVTTNLIARGIDILQVNCVVNFDMPLDQNGRPDAETYLHRIGRTGRFGRTG